MINSIENTLQILSDRIDVLPLETPVLLNSVGHLSDLRSELDSVAIEEGYTNYHLGNACARFVPPDFDGVHCVDALVSEQRPTDLPFEDRAGNADCLEEVEAVIRRERVLTTDRRE
jgi:hypothetical protein